MLMQREAPELGDRTGPGRPRVEALDDRILDAAVQLLDEGQDITVSKVVERSGVSRAALYRRWPSITLLTAAALDVGRVEYPAVRVGDNLRDTLMTNLIPPLGADQPAGHSYPKQRLNQRLKLILNDPELQKAYWESHVARRRAPLEESLRTAIDEGLLRQDLDVSASIDALAGVVYYQFIVRGDDLRDPVTRARVGAAFDIIWHGMSQ